MQKNPHCGSGCSLVTIPTQSLRGKLKITFCNGSMDPTCSTCTHSVAVGDIVLKVHKAQFGLGPPHEERRDSCLCPCAAFLN